MNRKKEGIQLFSNTRYTPRFECNKHLSTYCIIVNKERNYIKMEQKRKNTVRQTAAKVSYYHYFQVHVPFSD